MADSWNSNVMTTNRIILADGSERSSVPLEEVKLLYRVGVLSDKTLIRKSPEDKWIHLDAAFDVANWKLGQADSVPESAVGCTSGVNPRTLSDSSDQLITKTDVPPDSTARRRNPTFTKLLIAAGWLLLFVVLFLGVAGSIGWSASSLAGLVLWGALSILWLRIAWQGLKKWFNTAVAACTLGTLLFLSAGGLYVAWLGKN